MEGDVKVIRTDETTVFLPPGGVGKVYRVSFTVGDSGPFTVDIKEADFHPDRVREAINKVAATVRSYT